MKRWRRALSFVSSVLLILAVGLWIRSEFRSDSFSVVHMQWLWNFASTEGQVFIQHGTASVPFFYSEQEMSFDSGPARPLQWGNVPRGWHFAGWEYNAQTYMVDNALVRAHVIALPYWFIALILAILPTIQLRRALRQQMRRKRLSFGQCLVCGYDLRASPDRCPECGASPPEKSSK